jgi:hypothetical protein
MAETINGLNEAVQNRVTTTFTPNVGGEYGGKYEGPKAKVLTKMNELIALGYSVQYECDASPVASLTFKTTTNSSGNPPSNPNADYVDTFQVIRNTVQKELIMSDHPYVAALSEDNLTALKNAMANPPVNSSPAFSGGSIAQAAYLWDLWQSGVRTVDVKQPVLRVTRITNPLYDAPFDLDYVDKILTTATMIADSGVPSNFAIGLASLAAACSYRTALSGVFAIRPDSLLLKFGWLKDAPTSETVGTSKNQYTLEYKFGLWDTAIYQSA